MAMAADIVIAEVEELYEPGELDIRDIKVPAPIVDYIYVKKGEKHELYPSWKRQIEKAKAKAKAKAEGGR